jgi:MFS family permease
MSMMARQGALRDLGSARQMGRFVLLCLGVWLHAADSLVVATIAPAIVGDIGGLPYLGWTISLYQIGAIVAGAATARLIGRIGMKRVQLLGALAYGVGCAIAALAPDIAFLLAARLVQGAGGGMLLSLSYVAVQRSFPEPLWGRLFGVVATIWGCGSLLGPLIGGVFADLGAWRLAFWFFALQAGLLAALVAALLSAPSLDKTARGRLQLGPLWILVAATLLVAHASVARTPAASAFACLLALGLLYVAARWDRRSAAPLLPIETVNLGDPVGNGLLMVLALAAGTTGFWAYGPLLLKILFNVDPLVSGYILAGESLAWSAASLAVANMPPRADAALIRGGVGFVAICAAGFAAAAPAGTLLGLMACAVAQGSGFGLCWPSIVRRIVQCAGEGERDLAAAAPDTIQKIGYALGASAVGIAANLSGLADGVSAGAAKAAGFWIFASFIPLLMAGLFCAWRFTASSASRASQP